MKEDREVFLFGSGFTKSFVPDAPLLIDDWGLEELNKEFQSEFSFPGTSRTSQYLTDFKEDEGKFDVEKILTRLQSFIPHNSHEERIEIEGLYDRIMKNHYLKIIEEKTKNYWDETRGIGSYNWITQEEPSNPVKAILGKLAIFVKQNNINCITLNCDTLFDEALVITNHNGTNYWQPDLGYGFFCKPIVPDQNLTIYPQCSMEYHKLHGSINWRVYKSDIIENGVDNTRHNIENIHHYEKWMETGLKRYPDKGKDFLESQLIERPLVVPPLLTKADFMRQPIFITIWQKAAKRLRLADHVTIIGYSIPETDFTVRSLLTESIQPQTKITYVTRDDPKENSNKEKKVREIFRYHKKDDLIFSTVGGKEWAEKVIGEV